MSKDDISVLRKRYFDNDDMLRNEKIEILEKKIKKMLKYPNKDPPANRMLVDYTIWKDIRVYCVFANRFLDFPDLVDDIIVGKVNMPRAELHRHKLNKYISIALEVEDRYKRIFVKT